MTEERTLGTRDRIVALLRGKALTVEELASLLGVTDNAVRSHLPALERDGLVEAIGRRPGIRKPSVLYRTTAVAEERLSRAYIPLLGALLGALGERLTADEIVSLLEDAGKRLAPESAPVPRDPGAAVERARAFLGDLGAVTVLERVGTAYRIRGASCPLGAVVRDHPEVCRALESLVAAIVGGTVREQCDRGERPSCCFEIVNGLSHG